MNHVTFADISVEARTQVILEAAEESAWAIESTDKKIERLRVLLTQQKAALGHGKWLPWVRETFGDSDAAIWKVQRWMRGKSNNAPAHYLDLPENEDTQPIVPRAERKTGRVSVTEPGQTVFQANAEHPLMNCERCGKFRGHGHKCDDDPNPAPTTNTKHSPATTKAKEADRDAPPVITPVIIEEPKEDDDPFRYCTFDMIVDVAISKLGEHDDQKKLAAKKFRKLADKLDPPKEGKTPSRSQLVSMIPDDWASELQKAAADWAEYKQARAKGERIQTIRAWELALDKFTKQPVATVVLKVNNAIEKSWKGWDHDSANQQSGGTIAGTGRIKPAVIDESAITWK